MIFDPHTIATVAFLSNAFWVIMAFFFIGKYREEKRRAEYLERALDRVYAKEGYYDVE